MTPNTKCRLKERIASALTDCCVFEVIPETNQPAGVPADVTKQPTHPRNNRTLIATTLRTEGPGKGASRTCAGSITDGQKAKAQLLIKQYEAETGETHHGGVFFLDAGEVIPVPESLMDAAISTI